MSSAVFLRDSLPPASPHVRNTRKMEMNFNRPIFGLTWLQFISTRRQRKMAAALALISARLNFLLPCPTPLWPTLRRNGLGAKVPDGCRRCLYARYTLGASASTAPWPCVERLLNIQATPARASSRQSKHAGTPWCDTRTRYSPPPRVRRLYTRPI